MIALSQDMEKTACDSGGFRFSSNYAWLEEPNSRILPITVALIASRAGPRYLRGSYSSVLQQVFRELLSQKQFGFQCLH